VQRFYDRRAPGRYVVLDCTYSDRVDSDYDNFTCRIAEPCRQLQRFSVPRAAAGVGRFNGDPRREGRSLTC
jgi:hypothetical protein